jgi:hypothetical protein
MLTIAVDAGLARSAVGARSDEAGAAMVAPWPKIE